jgi:thioredoxin 1
MRCIAGTLALILVLAIGTAGAAEAPYDEAIFHKLLSSGQPVALDFSASWCPTCRAQAPLLRSITGEPGFKDLTLLVADYDREMALRKTYNVSMQSTLIVLRNGKEVARSTGDTSLAGLTRLLATALH